MDRLSVRVSEPAPETTSRPPRSEPYVRTPPVPKEHHYRKAWAGSMSLYDREGKELRTLRFGAEANVDPSVLADRIAADVAAVVRVVPGIHVHCIQDAAPELRALPEALTRALPVGQSFVELVDIEHLARDYLDAVVDACEPEASVLTKRNPLVLTKRDPPAAQQSPESEDPAGGTLCPSTALPHGRRAQRRARERAEPPGAAGSPRPRRGWRARDLARSEHVGTMAGSMGSRTCVLAYSLLARANNSVEPAGVCETLTLRAFSGRVNAHRRPSTERWGGLVLVSRGGSFLASVQAEGDLRNMKGWYRNELLRDDRAIDRIWIHLRRLSKRLPGRNTKARAAVAAALRYIRNRKQKMRYASHHAANLPVGSGATEGTCWQLQLRVKRPGQSWQSVTRHENTTHTPGLHGIMSTRGLVLSDRWDNVWPPYAAKYRRELPMAA